MTSGYLALVANHLWQSTVFAVVVWLFILTLRRNSAALRYRLWMAASVKFLIPFSLLAGIGSQFEWRTARVEVPPPVAIVAEAVGGHFMASSPSSPAAGAPVPEPRPSRIPVVLVSVWLSGVAVSLVWWFVRWRHVRRAVRRAMPLNIDLPFRVLCCRENLEPGVVGIIRPILLLPDGILNRLSPGQVQSVLAHELCHIRRRDNLTAAIHMVVEALFWFHPLVWWIKARLIDERERACDEEVLRLGGNPRDYAESILRICEFYLTSPMMSVSGISGYALKRRIEAIMRNKPASKLGRPRKAVLAAGVVIAVAAPVASGVRYPLPAPLAAATAAVLAVEALPTVPIQIQTPVPAPAPVAQTTPPRSGASIEGIIRDKDNEPAAGVRVSAVLVAAAESGVMGDRVTYTNADGSYRIEGLLAGRYHLLAGSMNLPSHYVGGKVSRPTYYPGVNSLDGATAIPVVAGASLVGMDFAVNGVTVRGKILNIPPEWNPLGRAVGLYLLTNSAVSDPVMTAPLRADGSFKLVNPAPGPYSLAIAGLRFNPGHPWVPFLLIGETDVSDFVVDLKDNPFPDYPLGSVAVVFDTRSKVTLRGTIKEPVTRLHVYLPFFRVEVADGNEVSTWGVVAFGAGPETVNADAALAPGTVVTVTGSPARDGTHRLMLDGSGPILNRVTIGKP